MNLANWFRRPGMPGGTPADDGSMGAEERITAGVDGLLAAQQRIIAALAALNGDLQASRGQWDEPTRAAYQRMQQEWQASLQRMDATIARVRSGSDD